MVLRDNAANMVAAFTDDSGMPSAGCLSHSLQLVIKSDLLGLPSVEKLIQKVKNVVSFANHSDKFYVEFRKQQKIQMEDGKELNLIQDVVTRWNSTFYMLERFLKLKNPLISSMAWSEDIKVEFRNEDWKLLDKVVTVLKCFEEATKRLSCKSASISLTIPIVTIIIKQLETGKNDFGVKTLKRDLRDAMEVRFGDIEDQDKYTLSTFLDCRFKGLLYRKKETLKNVKQKLIHLIMEELEKSNLESDQNMNVEMEEGAVFHTGDLSVNSKAKDIFETTMEGIIQRSSQKMSTEFEVTQFVEQYANSKVIESLDEKESFDQVLQYWKSMESSMKPIDKVAAKLANHYLTPPATSVDVERLFSTAGDIRTQERNRLTGENAGQILFLKENLPRINFEY
mgnify:CR=1 FL=1